MEDIFKLKDGSTTIRVKNKNITHFTIPNCVTTIGYEAFCGCSALQSIDIPNSVTSIGHCAFKGCSALKSIDIPSSVTVISDSAFANCSTLQNINVAKDNEHYTSIDGILFSKDLTTIFKLPIGKNLEKYQIPNSVTTIDNSAFWGCSSLKSIDIPNSITTIGNSAFWDCSSLKSINIPNCVTTISNSTFLNCSSLQSIDIPNSVTSIGEDAFSRCSSLRNIDIPNSVTYIGMGAFADCTLLQSIDIPNKINEINAYTFSNCPRLQHIIIPSNVQEIGGYAFYNCRALKRIKLPNGLTRIRSGAFYGCSALKEIIIPNSVKSIWAGTFQNCSALKYINIPSKVNWIGASTFSGCSALEYINVAKENQSFTSIDGILFDKNITKIIRVPMGINKFSFPNSITIIGEYAFEGCYALQSIEIPNSIIKIEECAFKGCTALQSINVSNNNQNYASLEGVLYDKELRSIITFPCKKYISEYKIPDSVTMIMDYAFEHCSLLKNICIPSSITTIGNYAFSDCNSLQSICLQCTDIRNVHICESAFENIDTYNCILHIPQESHWTYSDHPVLEKFYNIKFESLDNTNTANINNTFKLSKDCKTITGVINTSIIHTTIPNSVTTIGQFAFHNCSFLQSIDIPNSVTKIEMLAFDGCPALQSINIPNSVTKIESGAFASFSPSSSLQCINVSNNNNCYTSINGVLFNKDLTVIMAFPRGKELEEYNIPNSVTTIDSGAFLACLSLHYINIPNSVITIQEEAFAYCLELRSISVDIVDIENTNICESAFYGIDTENCVLYIPPGTRWAYRHHPVFGKFKNIEIEKQE